MKLEPETIGVLVAITAVGLGVVVLAKKAAAVNGGLIQGAASAAAKAAGDAAVGTVIGIGQVVGIPETSDQKCTVDLANGDFWAASFSCTATRYLKAVVGMDSTSKAANDLGQIDRITERAAVVAPTEDHYDAMGNYQGTY